MDRGGKSSQGRGGKTKTPQYPADIFALGKSSSDTKRPNVVHSKPGSSHSIPDRKREASSSALGSSLVAPKKQKPGLGTSSILGRAGMLGGAEAWEMVALDCDPADLVPSVLEAYDLDEGDRVVGLLCGAVRSLRTQRWKPDNLLYTDLCYLAKIRPSLLANDCVVHALASLLRRDPAHVYKSKSNPVVSVLAANMLLCAFQEKKNWPELFLKLYVEDSLGDRVWVDHEDCAGFVGNIVTAFSTRLAPRSLLQPEIILGGVPLPRSEACPSPSTSVNTGDDDSVEASATGGESGMNTGSNINEGKDKMDIYVMPRYSALHEAVEQIVMEAIREQLNRRQPAENITRNFLRLMASCCGLVEVRLSAVPRLELWLQNPKLMRPAQELLLAVCLNCNTHSQRDIEVVSQLVKIRLKTKALINLYLSCIRELISAHPDNLATVLKHTIYNELSTARNPNNMVMLSVMFQSRSEDSADILAEIFQELLMNREDYLRPLRALLREIVRAVRHDINLGRLCRSLLKEKKDIREFDCKERMFLSVADLATLCIFLGISPAVREAYSIMARGDKREISVIQNFQTMASKIQRDAVWWLHDIVPKVYHPSATDFLHALRKVLFVEHPEHYYNKDNWPPEGDRGILLRYAAEVPLLQPTLLCVLLMGLSKEHQVTPLDALELADQIIKRAAAISTEGFAMLEADKLEFIDLMFNLTVYRTEINLPIGYTPPQLAVASSYWKSWIMLLMLAAHNPTTFGSVAWDKYPTLRMFMEMCITNHFQFPPPTMSSGELAEEIRSKELQVIALEKQQILEYETYLAIGCQKPPVTEQSSFLLQQLITLDPTGPPRQPPPLVLEQLKSLNTTHRMGHLLCRSRRPDFLLDIIQRQGTSQSMPWLADLVESSDGGFSHLPIQCLCEFLLSSGTANSNNSTNVSPSQPEKQLKHQQLLRHLQAVLTDPEQDSTGPSEILEYFLRRLGSSQTSSRAQAIKGLKQVLSSVTGDEEPMDVEQECNLDSCSWLLRSLPALPHFPAVRPHAIQALRQACQVENEPTLVSSYIRFLAAHAAHDALPELADLVLDMSQLIVERSSIVAAILPSSDRDTTGTAATQHALMLMFHSFLQKAREPRHEGYPWSESQDQILVTWSSGEQATMHVLIVHAIIILLNYGPPQVTDELFDSLLDMWFPLGRPLPKAYLVMTSEEALLIPDWLKLRMIRSNVDRLVDAALTDLEPGQLVLFIQSFGIPVRSMSKLLHTLDRAVKADPGPVAEAVLDKSYMAQLVEVQHHRGAQGGYTLVEVLHLEQPRLPESRENIPVSHRQPLPPLAEIQQNKQGQLQLLTVKEQLVCALENLFNPTSLASQRRQIFKLIQKSLAMESQQCGFGPLLKTTLGWLFKNIAQIVDILVQEQHMTASLLRLLASRIIATEVTSLQQLTSVLRYLMNSPSLVSLIRPLLRQLRSPEYNCDETQQVETSDPIKVLQQTPSSKLERVGSRLLDSGVRRHCTQQLVEGIAKLLLSENIEEENDGNSEQMSVCNETGVPSAHIGLLIDWLAAVEPELIGLSPDLQMQLLFARPSGRRSKIGTNTQTCRPYLLSLLTHRAGWRTLHRCMTQLLERCDVTSYHPPAVLDFLWALTRNPRLWQGRDHFTPKHYHPEDVLKLTSDQLLVLVEYIVSEAETNFDEGASSESILDTMESRLNLLQQCLSKSCLATVSRFLVKTVNHNTGTKMQVAGLLLLLLYLRRPALLHSLSDSERAALLNKADATSTRPSLLDAMSHTMLTALTAGSHTHIGKDWTRRSHEYELLARKMASVHPLLVLRQLPMLAAALQGRVHLELAVFRSRHHLILFGQVLGLLELLRPWIFAPEHATGLHGILSSYLALARQHGHAKDVATLLVRLVTLLQAFLAADAPRALKFLQQHASMLRDLQHIHPSISALRALLASISLPKTDGEDSSEAVMAVVPPSAPPVSSPHFGPILTALSRHQVDEVLTALQDLDHISTRKPSVLEIFMEPLSDMLTSPSVNIRSQAHTLLVRYMRHDPSSTVASAALSAFVRCLESDQPDILNTALERMPEVVTCMQEHAVPLMLKTFRLGMFSNVNTAPSINKTIALLNVQAGC